MFNNIKLLNSLKTILSESQLAALLPLVMKGNSNDPASKLAIQELVEKFDLEKSRAQLGKLLSEQMPFEDLVPEQYRQWRPIVREAVIYLGSQLSMKRLLPKLLDQVLLPQDTTLEKRLLLFVEKMPGLQKLGQVIARNRNLHADLRKELVQLENGIHDTSIDDIREEIERQLDTIMAALNVEMRNTILAEASVSALVRFSWINPDTNCREQGVFKVIKPHIHANFAEELSLLKGLARHLDTQQDHVLEDINLEKTFADIADSLQQELETRQEQANLHEAYARYNEIETVRVPVVIEPLSTGTITAMSYEPGCKVTDAFKTDLHKRTKLARQIVEALVAAPLFSATQDVMFHADPHAGNLYVNEHTQQLILFDWALTGRLQQEERRRIILLFLGLFLRDNDILVQSIESLACNRLSRSLKGKIRKTVTGFIDELPLYQLPTMENLLGLVDTLLFQGVRFSPGMMLFRKVLLTLDGVLHDIIDRVAIEKIIGEYVFQRVQNSVYQMGISMNESEDFSVPLSAPDTLSLAMSAQWYYYRTGMQYTRNILGWFNQ